MPGQIVVYDIIPGTVSLYSFMKNTTVIVNFPDEIIEFKQGIIYSFDFTDTGLSLIEKTSVLQSIPPIAPDNVQAEAITNSSVSIMWNEVYGATSYRIFRAVDSPIATYSHIGSSSTTIFNDTTISSGVTYYYAVSALSGLDNIGVQSIPVSINMSPSNLRLIASTTINITLAWNVFNAATGYNLYRSNTENGNFIKINTEPLTTISLTDTNVLPDTTYYYKVSAIIGDYETLQSNLISASTLLSIPVNVRSTAVSTINIIIAWNELNGSSGFNVYRSNTANGAYTKLNTNILTVTTFNDTNVIPDTTYFYKVSSINSEIESDQSIAIGIDTLSSIPANIRSTDSTTININIAWNELNGASGFNIYRSNSVNGIYSKLNTNIISSITFSDTNVLPDTTYFYKVSSINNNIEGLQSSALTVSTLSSLPENIRVSSVSSVSTTIVWNSVNGASGYNIYRSNEINGTYTKINSNPIIGTTFTVTNLSHDTVFYYKVRSIINNIEGLWSNHISSLGTIVNGSDLSAKLTWLSNNTVSNNVYLIEVEKDENLTPHTLSYSGKNSIVVILRGKEQIRTINLSTQGRLFTIGSSVTLILSNNITLKGRSNNNSLVYINYNGTLEMYSGAQITGNTVSSSSNYYSGGGGVYIDGGSFIMNGGEIFDNTVSGSSYYAGGVLIDNGIFIMNDGEIYNNKVLTTASSSSVGGGIYAGGTFIMNGGNIYNNSVSSTSFSSYGGGICVSSGGTITMNGGEIFGNSAIYGGGVCLRLGPFTMNGGKITNNKAEYGGGVCVYNRVFTMNGGEISGNSASSQGGGVYNDATFRISGGVVYGNSASSTLRNTSSSGAALYINPPGDGYFYTPTAEYGILNGIIFSKSGELITTNTTIRITNGILQTN